MISHNICYSTILGHKDSQVNNENVSFGFAGNNIKIENLSKKDVIATFNGSYFVKEKIFKGIIPKILEEFFFTRVSLKNSLNEENKQKIEAQ